VSRRYQSALRAEQAEHTRERILRGLAAELGAGAEEFSIPRVAERAGVSVRTVHHYFRTRAEQVAAVARYVDDVLLKGERGPSDAADLPDYVERLYRSALANEELTRTLVAPGVATEVRKLRRKQRLDRIGTAVRELDIDAGRARLLAAALKVIASADFALALIDQQGLAHEEAAAAARMTVEALLTSVKRVPTKRRAGTRGRAHPG
jgi:AcrR family transcriptional regulator